MSVGRRDPITAALQALGLTVLQALFGHTTELSKVEYLLLLGGTCTLLPTLVIRVLARGGPHEEVCRLVAIMLAAIPMGLAVASNLIRTYLCIYRNLRRGE